MDYDIPESIKRSSIYQKLTDTAIASLSAGDVYDAIQAITKVTPENIGYLQFLIDLWKALQVATDGYPLSKDSKWIPREQPYKTPTNDDNAVKMGLAEHYTVLMSVYQDSGGALTLNVGNSDKSIILYTATINNATLTVLTDLHNIRCSEYIYCWWSAAAGVNQYVNNLKYRLDQVDQDGTQS